MNTELVFTVVDVAGKISRRLDRSLSSIKGISFSEYQLLSALRAQPASSATRVDLASDVGLTPSGVTRALKPLERLGVVETTKDARDARRSLATLTPTGHELLTDADGVVEDTLSGIEALGQLPAERSESTVRLLQDLVR
jgi:DNA-binding MarR family transcriptional regulator